MNNSQQMLQALEEQDLTKAEHYFVKALENDPSDLLYELATYLEVFILRPRKFIRRL